MMITVIVNYDSMFSSLNSPEVGRQSKASRAFCCVRLSRDLVSFYLIFLFLPRVWSFPAGWKLAHNIMSLLQPTEEGKVILYIVSHILLAGT